MSSPILESLNLPRNHEMVNAGAGAGKTYTLAHKALNVASAYIQQGKTPHLVLTTFTRKAASELRERIMKYALERGSPELIEFVNTRSELLISTIHGILSRFLQRFGGSLGLDAGFQLIGTCEGRRLAKKVLRDLVKDNADAQLLITRYKFEEVLERVEEISTAQLNGLKPWSEAEIQKAYQDEIQALKVSGEKILLGLTKSDHPVWKKVVEVFKMALRQLTDMNWTSIDWEEVKAGLELPRGKSDVSAELKDEFKQWRTSFRDLCGNPAHNPENWQRYAQEYEILDRLTHEFVQNLFEAKMKAGKIEIGDLERLTLRICRAGSSGAELAKSFAAEWDYWMIDEFQDTSPIQVELIKFLSGGRPRFKVGDPQQSIYQFRGARSEVFHSAAREVADSGGFLHQLNINRRSRPSVLEFINLVFRPHTQFSSMDPHLELPNVLDMPSATLALNFESGDSEAEYIIANAKQWHSTGVQWSQMAVLGRTHDMLAELAKAFRQNGIPFSIVGGGEFYRRLEIQEVLAFLRFSVQPNDIPNLVTVLRASGYLDSELAARMRKGSKQWRDFENDESAEIAHLRTFLAQSQEVGPIESLSRLLQASAFFQRWRLLDPTGRSEANVWKLLALLRQEEKRSGFSLNKFLEARTGKFLQVDPTGDAELPGERNFVSLMTVHAAKGLEFDYVILPQMQKGMANDYAAAVVEDEASHRWGARVAISSLRNSDACLPMKRALEDWKRRQMLECERLFYVAMTRAKHALLLTAVQKKGSLDGSFVQLLSHLEKSEGRHEFQGGYYLVQPKVELENGTLIESNPIKNWKEPLKISRQSQSLLTSATELIQRRGDFKSAKEDLVNLTARADRGTRVHRLLEALKYPSREILQSVVRGWFPGQVDEVLAAIRYVQNHPILSTVIENGEVEWGFSFVHENSLIEGQIDMWGRAENQIWIVDYKTGDSSRSADAFQQMRVYALALLAAGEVNETEKVMLAAVYPFEEQIKIQEWVVTRSFLNDLVHQN